jgi:hypothetical protein
LRLVALLPVMECDACDAARLPPPALYSLLADVPLLYLDALLSSVAVRDGCDDPALLSSSSDAE